jgi:hypothetical protein
MLVENNFSKLSILLQIQHTILNVYRDAVFPTSINIPITLSQMCGNDGPFIRFL